MDSDTRYEREHKATNALIRDIEDIIFNKSLTDDQLRREVRRAIHKNEISRVYKNINEILS